MLVRHVLILAAALSLGACGGATPWSAPALGAATPGAFERSLKEPVLIAFDDQSGRLESWPLRGRPNERPRFISGRLGITVAGGMAGNGDVLSIAGYSPAALVAYDLDTKTTTTLTDPFGQPFDVAIDKNGTRYVLDTAGVTVYKAGSQQPYQLSCNMHYYSGSAIAVRSAHVALALEINRERQRVHHGAAAALADIRRQRVRGVADDGDAAGRPALELDQIEAVVAALVADAVDQRFEMRKGALPFVLAHRHRLAAASLSSIVSAI